MPSPRDRHTGIPTGHPNSTVLISSPMSLRSSGGRLFSHSRSGSPPPSVRKKIAGTRLPCVPPLEAAPVRLLAMFSVWLATHEVYHIRYKHTDSRDPRSVPNGVAPV